MRSAVSDSLARKNLPNIALPIDRSGRSLQGRVAVESLRGNEREVKLRQILLQLCWQSVVGTGYIHAEESLLNSNAKLHVLTWVIVAALHAISIYLWASGVILLGLWL